MRKLRWPASTVTLIGAIFLLAALSVPETARPAEARRDRGKTVINCLAETPVTERQVLADLSGDFHVSEAELRAERGRTGLGWSDFSFAYRIAKKAGLPLDRIAAERKKGMGWCEIARDHNVRLGFTVIEGEKPERGHPAETPGAGGKTRGTEGPGRRMGPGGRSGR